MWLHPWKWLWTSFTQIGFCPMLSWTRRQPRLLSSALHLPLLPRDLPLVPRCNSRCSGAESRAICFASAVVAPLQQLSRLQQLFSLQQLFRPDMIRAAFGELAERQALPSSPEPPLARRGAKTTTPHRAVPASGSTGTGGGWVQSGRVYKNPACKNQRDSRGRGGVREWAGAWCL